MSVNAGTVKAVAIFGAVAIVGYGIYKSVDTLKKHAPDKNTFNPISDKNLAYRGANAVVKAVTDQSNKGNDSLGGWLAEKFSKSVHDVGALLGKTGGSVPPSVAQTTMAQAPTPSDTITIAPYNSNQNELPDTISTDPFSNPFYPGKSFSTAPYDSASSAADAGASAAGTIYTDTSNAGEGVDIAEFLL